MHTRPDRRNNGSTRTSGGEGKCVLDESVESVDETQVSGHGGGR